MKYRNTLLIIAFVFGLGFLSISAQQKESHLELVENLTAEQVKLLKNQKELIKKNREAFKASLTKKQLKLLKNVNLSIKDRQKELLSTLTSTQKSLLQQQQLQVQQMKNQFRASITTEQREMLRLQLRNRTNLQESKELINTVRERRKNKQNGNGG